MHAKKLFVATATVASVAAFPAAASAGGGDCNVAVSSCNTQIAVQSNSISVSQGGSYSKNAALVVANQQNFLRQTQVNAARVRIGW